MQPTSNIMPLDEAMSTIIGARNRKADLFENPEPFSAGGECRVPNDIEYMVLAGSGGIFDPANLYMLDRNDKLVLVSSYIG